jgi:two-component system, NarL family, nitrate/nitrite response regulator NarL
MSNPLRLLLLDDQTVLRESLCRALSQEPDIDVVGSCGTVAEAVSLVERETVDLAVIDYDLGFQRGTDFLSQSRAGGFAGKAMILAAWLGKADMTDLLRYGVNAVVLKERPLELVIRVIRSVRDGGHWIDERCAEVLLAAEAEGEDEGPTLPVFTDRERQVLRMVIAGLANKEIAGELHVSESAIKATIQRLFEKCSVRTRAQLVRVAIEQFSGSY